MNLTDANRPLRVLDKVLEGGLGLGNVGVVMARHGLGKVAVLTSIAIDHAMDGRNALHVSVGKSVSSVRVFHDEVLNEIMQSLAIADRAGTTTKVERHKQIYSFLDPATFSLKKLQSTLGFLDEHADFRPEMIELSGWPAFDLLDKDTLPGLRKIAQDWNCEFWISAHTHRKSETDERGIPTSIARCLDDIEVLIALDGEEERVNMRFLKTHGEPKETGIKLEFDPKTMLIRWR
jgi:hypothetical protein